MDYMRDALWIFFVIGALALAAEYMDATIGMGFGTTLTPILLLFGFLPLEVVPAVLIGQLAGGVIGGATHSLLGNVELDFKNDRNAVLKYFRGRGYIPRSNDAKVILILGIFGIIGSITGVTVAVNIPKFYLNLYIGLMVLGIGIWIIIKRSRQFKFSLIKLSVIGVVSAFNKGISGGGYGPLVTGGQIVSGKDARSSVGNTTLVEAVICLVAFISYLLLKVDIYWKLALATSVGSILAAPLAAITVKKVKAKRLELLIGIATVLLGLFTTIKMFFE